ncbi:FAD-dependent oxidoreductase [Gordonia sp. N1V]|uniref:FAD-dependent oxidoreductase n=1 Tax=Gordonia sp. N1V TaxID=3034163 RepID=UPI0023E32FB5|nr:FAD-dependent oxidoreductase [Gordonia sp. N1V]MDF3281096.1 FAD-dependent oxidoreductase [Gordonia sp. N1V]
MTVAERILVVGADAAGMSAAHQALRTARTLGRAVEVVVLERTQDTSYSACGIPYLVSGLVDSPDELSARTPEKHRAMGVDLRLGATAVELDMQGRVVVAETGTGAREPFEFDKLVLATGAEPLIPAWARDADGRMYRGIKAVKTLEDARYWLEVLEVSPRPHLRRGLVVGGGYIGLEMAEALRERGYECTLVTRSRVMSSMDPVMSERIESALGQAGVQVLTDTVVDGITVADDGTKRVRMSGGEEIDVDLIMLGLGVTPASALGADAGLAVGEHGGYLTDEHQRLAENVWAAGDCCEVYDRMRGKNAFLPLGTHANKQGRICGFNVMGESRKFNGALGTAITRFSVGDTHVEIARTGLSMGQAVEVGYDPEGLVTEGGTASGYMAERAPIMTNVIADRGSRSLLGVQIVGGRGAGKRIDTAAAALWGEMSVDHLAEMDLSYAPPFATVWEAIQLSARRLADRL